MVDKSSEGCEASFFDSKVSRRDILKSGAQAAGALVLSGALPAFMTSCSRPGKGVYDILIKGGLVCDGSTALLRRADIGIRQDRIIDIGMLSGSAARVIDAGHCIVTPGFIDVHTHCDETFKLSGIQRYLAYVLPSWKGNYNYLYQGVTTVVTGNCGSGYAHIDPWYAMLDSIGFGTNVYHLIPHGVVREELFGNDQPRQLSSKQLAMMKDRIAAEMEKGTVGMSTGLMYFPGFLTPTEEIIELCKVVRKHGGIYTSHIRDESGSRLPDGSIAVLASVKEALAIGERAEIPVEISHLKICAPFRDVNVEQILELIEKARLRGLEVHADQYPYEASSCEIPALLPNKFIGKGGLKDAYKTQAGRKEVQQAIEVIFSYLPPEKIYISMYKEQKAYEGKNLAEIAHREGVTPSDVYVRMACSDELPLGVYFEMRIDDVKKIMARDYILTGSDGWTVPKGFTKPHPRVYGTFPRKIRKYVLEEKVLSLPAAIRSMTSLPAEKFRIQARGKIDKGYYADIAVIDLEEITDRATYFDPHQYAQGIKYLVVNGVLAIDAGKATGERAGRTLRRG